MADRVTAMASRRRLMAMAPFPAEKSGELVSFNSKLKFPLKNCLVHIEPVQDLHGYDHPWPAGGGKNKCPGVSKDQTAFGLTITENPDRSFKVVGTYNRNTSTPFYSSEYAITLPAGDYILSGTPENDLGIYLRPRIPNGNYISLPNGRFTLAEETTVQFVMFVPTGASGVVLPSSGLLFEPMVRLASEKDATFAPYENICPITGWNGVKVTRTGKNLLGGDALALAIKNGASDWNIYPDDRRIRFSGASDTKPPFSNGLKFKENTQYTFIMTFYKTSVTHSNMVVRYTDGSYNYIPNHSSDLNAKETLVLVTKAGKTIKGFEKVNAGGYTHLYYDESGIFEGVLTADDFVPYKGESYDITFPTEAGMVYGGTLNVKTGELAVDMVTATISSDNILPGGKAYCRYKVGPLEYVGNYSKGQYCNVLPWFEGAAGSLPEGSFKVFDSAAYNMAHAILCFDGCRGSNTSETRNLNIAKLQELEEAGTPMQVCFGLATPIVYHLTPIEITALLGQNNLLADSGVTDVTYWTTT